MLTNLVKKEKRRGFTLIELMVVIAVIAILAALAVPSMTKYRTRGFNTSAKEDLKNSFPAAQGYFSDNPNGTLNTENLTSYGYIATDGVVITINDGTMVGLEMTATHDSGDVIYTMDSAGNISP